MDARARGGALLQVLPSTPGVGTFCESDESTFVVLWKYERLSHAHFVERRPTDMSVRMGVLTYALSLMLPSAALSVAHYNSSSTSCPMESEARGGIDGPGTRVAHRAGPAGQKLEQLKL